MPVDLEVASAAKNVFAKEAFGIGVADRLLHDDGEITIFAPDVDVSAGRTHSQSGDDDAFDDGMRIVLENQPVFAGSGLALVAVAEDIFRFGRLLGHERPLHAGGESRAAASA